MRRFYFGGLALLLGVGSCVQIFGIDAAETGWMADAGSVSTGAASTGASSSGTHGAASSSSGGPPPCSTPADCPSGGSCMTAQCNGGVCDLAESPAGTTCNEGSSGKVCDGVGHCVACNTSGDCGGTCVDGMCNNPIAVAVPGGANHTCAILGDGSVWCWGANDRGQIGDGTQMQRTAPTKVTLSMPATSVSAGGATGFTCAILMDGTLWCWGDNSDGELGVGSMTSYFTTPQLVTGIHGVVQVSTGGDHACAVVPGAPHGTLFCWGANDSGQLGNGGTTMSAVPTQGMLIFESGAVAAGDAHTCAISVGNGDLYCWGDNGAGQIGSGATDLNPHSTPIATGLSSVVDIVAGGDSTCARTQGGAVSCWGENGNGQLGLGSTMNQPTPTALTLTGATLLAMGSVHAGAITSSGLLMWGSNADGQLGDGTVVNSTSPEAINLQGASALGLAATSSCALTTIGELYCWGSNAFGQIGNGTTTDSHTPVRVVWP